MAQCIAIFDVKSMYPAIIIGDNIDISTKIVKEVMGERVVSFDKDAPAGLIPRVVRLSLDYRDEFRALRLEADTDELKKKYRGMEKSAKVGANATYGVLLYPPFRLYDKDCADAVTRGGRRIIRRLNYKCLQENIKLEALRKIIAKVIYGDTDSIFILLNCHWSDYREDEEGGLKRGSKRPINMVNDYLNEQLKDFCQELGYTEEVEGKIERILDRIFFKFRPAKKDEKKHATYAGGRLLVGAKKRYAGRCRWREGGGKVKEKYIKGFGRSDISVYTKGVYTEFWEAILEQGDVDLGIKVLREAWIGIKGKPWYDISVPRGVKGDFSEYEEDALKTGHIAATLYMIDNCKIKYNPMVKPRTVWVRPRLLGGRKRVLPVPKRIALLNDMKEPPKLVMKEMEIDYELQADTILKAPFELVVLSLGRQWSEVAQGTKQTTLDLVFDEEEDKQRREAVMEEELEEEFASLRSGRATLK